MIQYKRTQSENPKKKRQKDIFRTTCDARGQNEVFDFKWNIPTAQNIY